MWGGSGSGRILSFCRVNFEEKWGKLSGVFPEIQMLCDYEMKGQVLVVTVDGKGNSTIILSMFFVFFDFSDEMFCRECESQGCSFVRRGEEEG